MQKGSAIPKFLMQDGFALPLLLLGVVLLSIVAVGAFSLGKLINPRLSPSPSPAALRSQQLPPSPPSF